MRIVEIGCGDSAGPFFPGADEYFAVDISPLRVENAVLQEPRMTPMVADAVSMPDLADKSVDILLARNVFGDPFLGLERSRALELSFREGVDFKNVIARREVAQRKLAIIAEASRLLIDGGGLIIVEQYTPQVANSFVSTLHAEAPPIKSRLGTFEGVDLSSITPDAYAKKHLGAQAWIAVASPA
jgi:hypothetical protein